MKGGIRNDHSYISIHSQTRSMLKGFGLKTGIVLTLYRTHTRINKLRTCREAEAEVTAKSLPFVHVCHQFFTSNYTMLEQNWSTYDFRQCLELLMQMGSFRTLILYISNICLMHS